MYVIITSCQVDRAAAREQLDADELDGFAKAVDALFPGLIVGPILDHTYVWQALVLAMSLLKSANPDAAILTWIAEKEFVTPCNLFAAGVIGGLERIP